MFIVAGIEKTQVRNSLRYIFVYALCRAGLEERKMLLKYEQTPRKHNPYMQSKFNPCFLRLMELSLKLFFFAILHKWLHLLDLSRKCCELSKSFWKIQNTIQLNNGSSADQPQHNTPSILPQQLRNRQQLKVNATKLIHSQNLFSKDGTNKSAQPYGKNNLIFLSESIYIFFVIKYKLPPTLPAPKSQASTTRKYYPIISSNQIKKRLKSKHHKTNSTS